MQIFGFIFVGIIVVCVVLEIVEYIFPKTNENDKIMDNIKKMDRKV